MPVQINAVFVAGLVLCVAGALLVFVLWAKHGGMAFGFAAWTNVTAFLRDPAEAKSRRVFWLAVVATLLGGLVACGSILVGDAQRNRVCREACLGAGFETGRVRGIPHGRPGPKTAYACWCQRGGEWSAEPVAIPAAPAAAGAAP